MEPASISVFTRHAAPFNAKSCVARARLFRPSTAQYALASLFRPRPQGYQAALRDGVSKQGIQMPFI